MSDRSTSDRPFCQVTRDIRREPSSPLRAVGGLINAIHSQFERGPFTWFHLCLYWDVSVDDGISCWHGLCISWLPNLQRGEETYHALKLNPVNEEVALDHLRQFDLLGDLDGER